MKSALCSEARVDGVEASTTTFNNLFEVGKEDVSDKELVDCTCLPGKEDGQQLRV
jgi:hypothetical protein